MVPRRSFDLRLDSWFVFSYAQLFGRTQFAARSVLELLQVAREVRIYPLRSFPSGASDIFEKCTEILQIEHSHLLFRMPNGFLHRDAESSDS